MFATRGSPVLLAAVLLVGFGISRVQPAQAGQTGNAGTNPYNCTDSGVFIRCLILRTGPNQDWDELWECASGHLQFSQDDTAQQQVSFDGTCAIEVHHGTDPAWVWAGGYADHDQVCPAGQLFRSASGAEWEIGPDCVEAASASLDDLAPPDTWDTGPIAWSDGVPAPAACGWTQSC
jgi:hypothetical protein